MINIVCVLKSGGDYDWEYVWRLYKGVKKNVTWGFKFIVLTDMVIEDHEDIKRSVETKKMKVVPLEHNLPFWWSKLEVFRITGLCIYFDLDTMIYRDIGNLKTAAEELLYQEKFSMLQAFKMNRFASGIMCWNGNYRYILDEFTWEAAEKEGDQKYIREKLVEHGVEIAPVNKHLMIKSFKHHCQFAVPQGTDIICFHGQPRPRDTYLWKEEVAIGR